MQLIASLILLLSALISYQFNLSTGMMVVVLVALIVLTATITHWVEK